LYKGLRVIGGDLVVHSNGSGASIDTTHSICQAVELDIRARLGGAEALRTALAQCSGSLEVAPQLVVYARGDRPQLAYELMATAPERWSASAAPRPRRSGTARSPST
jgi:hypothetical protein